MAVGAVGSSNKAKEADRERQRQRELAAKRAREALRRALERAKKAREEDARTQDAERRARPTGRAYAEARERDREIGSLQVRRDVEAQASAKERERETLLPRSVDGRGRSGADAAREAVSVDQGSVRDDRERLADSKEEIDRRTRNAVAGVFDRADGKLPHGAEVTSSSDDRVEIVRRDHEGQALWREVAERDGERLRFERTDWKNGEAQRQTLETGGEDGSLERRESWKEERSRDFSSPSTDDLKERWQDDKSVRIQEHAVQEDDGELTLRQASFDANARSEQETKFRTQEGSEGMHDELKEDFDDEKTTDVVETTSTSQQRGEDEESSSRSVYAQGNVRATASETGGDDAPPKQWMLEKQDGNEYRSQTFVENAPQFSTLVTRRADGALLHEETESKGLDEDGDEVESRSSSDTLFDEQGLIASKRVDSTDEKGVRTLQEYRRETEENARGLEVREWVGTQRTQPGDPPARDTSDREIHALETAEGRQLLESRETTSSPDGTATSVIDERGPRLTVNGKAVPVQENSEELGKLSEGEIDLAAHVSATTFGDAKNFAALGGGGLNLLSVGRGVRDAGYDTKLTPESQERVNARLNAYNDRLVARFGADKVENAFRAQSLGSAGSRSVAGLFGLAAAGAAMVDGVHGFNWNRAPLVALDSGSAAVHGAQGVAAAKELGALKAGETADDAGQAAGKFGQFARFGGLALGTAAGGYEAIQGLREGDRLKVAQGGVTIAGTVGAFVAVGAIGGLPGMLVGAGIGLAAVGVRWAVGEIFGGDPEIAEKRI